MTSKEYPELIGDFSCWPRFTIAYKERWFNMSLTPRRGSPQTYKLTIGGWTDDDTAYSSVHDAIRAACVMIKRTTDAWDQGEDAPPLGQVTA